MAIKIFESRENLKNKLRNRGLEFDSDKLDNVLKKYNYFDLFNGFESLLLSLSHPKKYINIKLEDFLNLYEFDELFTARLLRYLNRFEKSLKSSISYHFTSMYCNTINDTMQYTNKENYMNPKETDINNRKYCRYSNNYPFAGYQNKGIYNEFDNFCLFKPYFLTNLVDKNDHIKIDFYTDTNYNAPSNVAIYRDINHNLNYNVAVPFWVAIETLTFGETLRILHYLKDEIMEKVLEDFKLSLPKRTIFLNMVDFLLCLRNSCAHNSLVNRFRTPNKYKVNAFLVSTFNLNPSNTDNSQYSILKLFDVMKLLSYFENIYELKEILDDMIRKNRDCLGFDKGDKLNKKILKRMGCEDYLQWEELFLRKFEYM